MKLTEKLREMLLEWANENYKPILEENKRLKDENKQLKQSTDRYRSQAARLKQRNNRLKDLLDGRISIIPEEHQPLYACYDTSEGNMNLVIVGNLEECSECTGLSIGMIRQYAAPSAKGKKHKYKVVRLNGRSNAKQSEMIP